MSTTVDPEKRGAVQPPQAVPPADPAIRPGTVLRDYELRGASGSSAWSIAYEAWDRSQRRRVVVQEYRPARLARRRADGSLEPVAGAADRYALGLKAFIAEARLLARFDHPALLRIYRFWEERGTAYRAVPLHDGPTLERVLAEGLQDEASVRAWLGPVLDALSVLHAANAWHLHVVPTSIVITSAGPLLLEMSAARSIVEGLEGGAASGSDAHYAAIELDARAGNRALGPWTDLYALAAVAYRALAGIEPPPATERARDDRLAPLRTLAGARCSTRFASALDAALAVEPERRPRDDTDFRALAGGFESASPPLPSVPARDLMSVPFLADRERAPAAPVATHAAGDGVPQSVIASVPPDSRVARQAQPFPLSASEPNVPRAAWWALAAGVVVMGVVAAVAVRGYAQRGAHVGIAATDGSELASDAVAAAAMAPALAPPLEAQPPMTPMTPADDVRTVDVSTPPRDDRDRQERCGDLLQEATLRRLGAAESAFFKKECR
ncbi:MAG TPA: hypothetical protein VMU47_19470 [Caldimonas sp.]|nr:hypothetical protein [Caldimonas sp.]